MRDPFDWQGAYPAGVHRALDVPSISLGDLLIAAERRGGTRPALLIGDDVTTYGALLASARAVCSQLRCVTHSGRALVRLPSDADFVAAIFGTYLAGWTAVPVGPDTRPATLDEIVADTRPSWTFDGPPAAAGHDTDAPRVDPDAPAVLQYTSGTTGGRKAAVMTHRNLVANAIQNNAWFGWSEDDVVLGVLPLHHTWGLSCVLHATIAARARAVLIPRFGAESVLAAIEQHAVTVAYGSATMFHRLLDAVGDDATRVFASLRYVKAGAMLVGSDLAKRWAAAVPNVPMVLGYGLTEASPEVCNNPLHAGRPGTVGVPLPGTDVRVRDPENPGRDVSQGAEGELHVRGPQVTRGYWNRPAETGAVFTHDGWLRTGDLARFDEAGYVQIVDRIKDLIKFRGHSIVPGEIEAVLRSRPGIRDAVVVGAVHAVDGEIPTAFLEVVAGAAPSLETLATDVEPLLVPHARPRRYVIVDRIPRNHVGKPLRRVLRERASMARRP